MKRLPEEIEIKKINFLDYKDANEVLMAGLDLKDFIKNSVVIEEEHYIKLSEIDQHKEQLKFSTGSKKINRMIGGLRCGELTIWTGRGEYTLLDFSGNPFAYIRYAEYSSFPSHDSLCI